MAYTKELEFITSHIREAYTVYALAGPQDVRQKSAFDLVTEVNAVQLHIIIVSVNTPNVCIKPCLTG